MGVISEDTGMQALPADELSDSGLPTPQLLVADDSSIQRRALCSFLRGSGYDVDEAGDGHQVLRHLRDCEVDLLLLDLNMPDGDGFEVLKYLQQHRRALPVILLSGMPLDQIQHRMHRLPQQELPPLLIKPIDPEQLIQMVEYLLNHRLMG
jgi:CheY-like chemotaxis protein